MIGQCELGGELIGDLTEAGFQRSRGGLYRRNGFAVSVDRGWLCVQSGRATRSADPLRGMVGRPGLWRWVDDGSGWCRQVFELPHVAWADRAADDTTGDRPRPGGACIDWAVATAAGAPPQGFSPPPPAHVEQLIPEGSKAVCAGEIVRACEVVSAPGRLALRCPLVSSIPDDLPEPRREWLEATILDAQRFWRMVRVGIDGEPPSVVAEVDLTGAPVAILGSLVPAAVDALRWVVAWAAKTAAVIVSDVESKALAVGPVRAKPGKGARNALSE
ncbi:MAG: hypothetical protein ACYS0G_11785 [Planctomycetota bacterium]|jgi:hypothetical protein